MKNCINYGSILSSGSSKGNSWIGGIGGVMGSKVNYFYNCFNYGTITHSGTSGSTLGIGGIAGLSSYSVAKNWMNVGKITALNQPSDTRIGGIVGWISSTSIYYCYFTSNTGTNSLYGSGAPESITESSTSAVSVDSALLNKLNNQVASNSDWNKWVLNKNKYSTTFKVNGNKGFSVASELILLPNPVVVSPFTFNGMVHRSLLLDSFPVRIDLWENNTLRIHG